HQIVVRQRLQPEHRPGGEPAAQVRQREAGRRRSGGGREQQRRAPVPAAVVQVKQRFFPVRAARQQVQIVQRQQVEMVEIFQQRRRQCGQFAAGQQRRAQPGLFGLDHGGGQQVGAPQTGVAVQVELPRFAGKQRRQAGQNGLIGAGDERLQSQPVAQAQRQRKLGTHERLSS